MNVNALIDKQLMSIFLVPKSKKGAIKETPEKPLEKQKEKVASRFLNLNSNCFSNPKVI